MALFNHCVNSRYLRSIVALELFVSLVNLSFFSAEAGRAQRWCGDFANVKDAEIVAAPTVEGIAGFDGVETLRVFASLVDVLDAETHLDRGVGVMNWMPFSLSVGLRCLEVLWTEGGSC